VTHRTVLEWGRVEVGDSGFSRPQADALLAAARSHVLGGNDGTDILCDHHRFLRARQAVGVIAARGCSLEILPKVDAGLELADPAAVRARLVHMLDVAHGLNLSSGEATAMARRADSLLDIFVALFADRLLAEVRRGLPRQYRAEEDDLRALRGKLDVVRQFTVHAVRPDRLACRFDALDGDTPLMRIMKACVLLLTRHAKASSTQRKLAELRFLMADISDVPRGSLPWKQVRIDRSSQRWRALLQLARLLVGSSWQQTHAEAGTPDGITLLFAMNDLFERYVAVQLRKALGDTDLTVDAQGGGAYCVGPWIEGETVVGNSHPTRPDILVKRRGQIVAILDTKWKPTEKGVSHADIYQMMAYARLYDCQRLVLLYPASGCGTGGAMAHGLAAGEDRLDVANVALNASSSTIRQRLRELIMTIVPHGTGAPSQGYRWINAVPLPSPGL
jgi:5-methylcytosine-specific restriction enzyme subunit McrC